MCTCIAFSIAGHASALGALVHLLRSPSRILRTQGQAFLHEHYHMRPHGAVQVGDWHKDLALIPFQQCAAAF
jgi:hypothetical protein